MDPHPWHGLTLAEPITVGHAWVDRDGNPKPISICKQAGITLAKPDGWIGKGVLNLCM